MKINVTSFLMPLLAASFLMAAPEGPAAAQEACSTVLFGRHCQPPGSEPSFVNGRDYGYVELGIVPPANVAITRANRRNWVDAVRRYFVPRARSGQIIARIYLEDGGQRTALATVPVALFEIDEKTGVKMVEEATLSAAPVRVTPYFRLTQSRYSVYYEIEVRSSDQTTSMVVDRVRAGTVIATDFGGTGWLSTAMGADAVVGRLQAVERDLIALRNSTGTSLIRSYLAPHNQPTSVYQFGFVPNETPTGVLTLRFRRLPSLFADQATSTRAPVYDVTMASQRSRFLSYKTVGNQDIGGLLQSRITPPAWATLASETTEPAVFNSHCISLVDDVSTRLDLSEHDATAVIWAAFNRGNMTRKAIRDLQCVKQQEPAFAALGLPMPAVDPSTSSPSSGGISTTRPAASPTRQPATAVTFSQNELKDFMGGLFAALRMEPNVEGKSSILQRQFAESVSVAEDFQIDNDFPSVSPAESPSSLARTFASPSFTLSCYWRAQDSRITFFGRRRDEGPFNRQLWTFTISLGSLGENASVSDTRITSLAVREARAADFEVAKNAMPSKPECHSERAVA